MIARLAPGVAPDRALRELEGSLRPSSNASRSCLVGDPAAVNLIPFGLMGWAGDFEIEGGEPVNLSVAKPAVSAGCFRSTGIPLLDGRFFEDGDGDGAPLVAIVSENVARTCWPNGSAIGRRITMEDRANGRWLTVIGVVDVRQDSLESKPMPAIYVPIAQEARGFFLTSLTYVVRPQAETEVVASALRHEVRALDPELPIRWPARFDRILSISVAEPRAQFLMPEPDYSISCVAVPLCS